jgi:YVTN family beta-propeller protein
MLTFKPKMLVTAIGASAFIAAAFGAVAISSSAKHVRLPDIRLAKTVAGQAVILPNGWQVTPAGLPISLAGDLPLGMKTTPDGKYLLVSTSGFHNQGLYVIALDTQKLVQNVELKKTFYGLDIGGDGAVYASGGNTPDPATPNQSDPLKCAVMQFSFNGGQLTPNTGIDLLAVPASGRYITGVAAGPDHSVFVANYGNDSIYKIDGSSHQIVATGHTGAHPYAIALSPNGKTLAVSNWGGGSVSLFDSSTLTENSRVDTGNHPNALTWGRDGRLFVTNAGSNSVSVIKGSSVVETIKTSLNPNDPVGSTPDAIAVSPDGDRVYVANADNNDVAVIDTSDVDESKVIGFIPTGWYPTAVAISPDGAHLYIGTGKGLQFTPNATPETKVTSAQTVDGYRYIADCLSGAVSIVAVPDGRLLAKYTKQVAANMPKPQQQYTASNKVDAEKAFKQIKHVIYIIRENRTYDEVFGDIPEGNGDPNICLFGQNVTPNGHALAEQYVLLDNLYCNGEVSEDGHQWCDAAYATDYTERRWVNNYSGRGAPKDDDGMGASPAGYLWDNCAKHGLTYKNYGEASTFHSDPGSPPVFTGPKALDGHASYAYSQIPWFGKGRDEARAQIFINDLDAAQKTGNWPQLMVMSLPEDHTQGLEAGAYTPTANVGENDKALGEIVRAVSHSSFWKDTAIFVIEDDGQNGPDHVDAHRTVGLIISPFTKKGTDSTMYSTSSFVRTIELILNIPPMTQFDQDATPTYNSFTSNANMLPFDLLPAGVDVEARNPTKGAAVAASDKLDFSAPDRADPDKLNAILWHALRPGVRMPAPVRSAWRPGLTGQISGPLAAAPRS